MRALRVKRTAHDKPAVGQIMIPSALIPSEQAAGSSENLGITQIKNMQVDLRKFCDKCHGITMFSRDIVLPMECHFAMSATL